MMQLVTPATFAHHLAPRTCSPQEEDEGTEEILQFEGGGSSGTQHRSHQ